MGATIVGLKAFFGEPEKMLPLRGFPEGTRWVRAWRDEFLVVSVETNEGLKSFYVHQTEDGFFEPLVGAVPPDPRGELYPEELL